MHAEKVYMLSHAALQAEQFAEDSYAQLQP